VGICGNPRYIYGDQWEFWMQNIISYRNNGFLGSSKYLVDSKNRVCIPQDFIDILRVTYKHDNMSVVTFLSLNRSIAVYPISNYYAFLESIQEKSILNKNMRRLLTMIQGSTSIQTIDGQNRLKISDELVHLAGVSPKKGAKKNKEDSGKGGSKEVYVKGFGDHIEIWGKKVWDKFIEDTINSIDEISDELSSSSREIK
jgi:DNA-binding transcriptional regulator/RsmH inhibitor MraZ